MKAKIWERELEIWLSPKAWCTEFTTPVSHDAIPKDWMICPGDIEVWVEPPYPEESGGQVVVDCLGLGWHGGRSSNPENPGGFITGTTDDDMAPQESVRILEVWEQSRMVQEAFSEWIWKSGQAVSPLNVSIPGFLLNYDRTFRIYTTIGMFPEGPGSQRVWAVVFIQEGRKEDDSDSEGNWTSYPMTKRCYRELHARYAGHLVGPKCEPKNGPENHYLPVMFG
jgi:hypothetical protein